MIRPTIRPLDPSHQAGLRELFIESGYPEAAEWEWAPTQAYVALYRGKVVGFAAIWHDGRHIGTIDWVLVTPKLRLIGIGIFLFKHAIRMLQEQGATRLHVMTRKDDVIKYVTRLGFQEVAGYRGFELRDSSDSRPTHPTA